MTKQDGEKIFTLVNDFLNTEMTAGNRITKYSASAFGNMIRELVNGIVKRDESNIKCIGKSNKNENNTEKKTITPEIIK